MRIVVFATGTRGTESLLPMSLGQRNGKHLATPPCKQLQPAGVSAREKSGRRVVSRAPNAHSHGLRAARRDEPSVAVGPPQCACRIATGWRIPRNPLMTI